MKLAVNLTLSLLMLAGCLWLVWPNAHDMAGLDQAFANLTLAGFWPYLAGYVGLLAVTHFCRAWRWNYSLDAIGVKVAPARLLAISSVGFMSILALPARLGEFVRPTLIRRRGEISASAALGTIAVERIVDGLLVSMFVFGAFFALRSDHSPEWMMPTAYAALGIFTLALVFLAFALARPKRTIHIAVSMTFAHKLSPKLGAKLEEKLAHMISGFTVLKDGRNMIVYLAWSLLYWIANGLGMYILAKAFGLGLSVVGAYATMGLIAVGITLPNAPGLVGQFQWFTQLGLMLYLPEAVAKTDGLAYAIVLHAIQVVWYVGIGSLALASKQVSFAEVWASRHVSEVLDEEAEEDQESAPEPPPVEEAPAARVAGEKHG